MLASCCGRRHLAGHTNRRRVSACRADPARIVANPVTPDDRVSSSGNASSLRVPTHADGDAGGVTEPPSGDRGYGIEGGGAAVLGRLAVRSAPPFVRWRPLATMGVGRD